MKRHKLIWGYTMLTPLRHLRLWLDWNLDHIPRPMVYLDRSGDRIDASVSFGPKGPDPIISVAFALFRRGVDR